MMEPLNIEERKQGIVKFILLYAFSIILLIAIYYFGFANSSNEGQSQQITYVPTVTGNEQSTNPDLLLNDLLLLNNYTRGLAVLDSQYNQKLFNATPKDLQLTTDSISKKESAFKTAINDIKAKTVYSKKEQELMLPVLDIYSRIFNLRQALNTERQAMIISQASINPADKDAMKLRTELLKKDARIAELENEADIAKMKQSETETAGINSNTSNRDKEKLLADLQQQKEITNNLSFLNDKLKEENTQLKNNGSKNAVSPDAVSKINLLQSKIDEISAELNFAQVECNLKRVDANQIISNSRQRRQILTQSLQSLSNLSKSGNSVVQDKAKAKIKELNVIAQNLRD